MTALPTLPVRRPDIDNAATRRQFLSMLAAAGLLAGCANDDDAPDAAPTPTPAARSVTTDNGRMEVPISPARVVAAIGSFETDMVAVGVMPVLTTTFVGPWVELDDSVEVTANIPPTAEELLQVRPDLIVGWNWVTKEAVFDEISAVAPYVGLGETAATAGSGFDSSVPLRSWDTLFLSVCEVIGKREEGQRLVDEFEARLDELAVRRSERGALSVARIEFYEPGSFSYRGQNEDTAALMKRIGLEVVGPEESENTVSLERLPEIDAEWLVVPVGGDSIPEDLFEEMQENPLYQAIPAVQAGQVHVVDGTLWPGLGHLWARALVDDLERLFVSEA